MDTDKKQALREFLKEALGKLGDHHGLSDDESLFLSGRLDSFSMMNLVMFLEESCQLDFSQLEFDVSLLDSVDDVERLLDSRQTQ
jgi:acyl carrier protein